MNNKCIKKYVNNYIDNHIDDIYSNIQLSYSDDEMIINDNYNYNIEITKKVCDKLYYYVDKDNLHEFKKIIKKYPQIINKRYKNRYLLHYALKNNKMNIAIYIIFNHEYTINKDHNGNTLLHYAVLLSNEKLIDILIYNSLTKITIDITSKNKDGNTPLHLALLDNNIRILEVLFTYYPRLNILNISNNDNKNILDLCRCDSNCKDDNNCSIIVCKKKIAIKQVIIDYINGMNISKN
jgi:hypothetical protein